MTTVLLSNPIPPSSVDRTLPALRASGLSSLVDCQLLFAQAHYDIDIAYQSIALLAQTLNTASCKLKDAYKLEHGEDLKVAIRDFHSSVRLLQQKVNLMLDETMYVDKTTAVSGLYLIKEVSLAAYDAQEKRVVFFNCAKKFPIEVIRTAMWEIRNLRSMSSCNEGLQRFTYHLAMFVNKKFGSYSEEYGAFVETALYLGLVKKDSIYDFSAGPYDSDHYGNP